MSTERLSVLEAASRYSDKWVILIHLTQDPNGPTRGEVFAIEDSYESARQKYDNLGKEAGNTGFVEGNDIESTRLGGSFLQ